MRGHKIITWSTPKQVQMREAQCLTDPVNRHQGQTRNSAKWCKKAKGPHVYTKGFWEYTHLGNRWIRHPWVINYCGRCGYRKIWFIRDMLEGWDS